MIFEAWNEPNDGPNNDAVPSSYLNYLTIMYGALRNSGVQNLIFMQWDMNFVPGYNDLSWASEITKAIPGAFNLAFHFTRIGMHLFTMPDGIISVIT